MLPATLSALSSFPDTLERFFDEVPERFLNWAPPSWEGVPSESLTVLEQVCHVRDIEIDGYQVRLRRMLTEPNPVLVSLDGYELAASRHYTTANPDEALASFRVARLQTVAAIAELSEAQWSRRGSFEGHELTVKGLVHLLCSHDQQHLAGIQWLLARIEGEAR
ncbi:DinB family protein [Pendulispora albinea]|uniref:DinB family protein n=1 Tax=Pendulispora albinea TaxID=2741071 RepID=A0ABZ2M996_9BACT